MSEANEKKGFAKVSGRIIKFFRDFRSEAKKIVWPTYKQVTNNTLMVIAAIFVIGALVWTLDWLLITVISAIL